MDIHQNLEYFGVEVKTMAITESRNAKNNSIFYLMSSMYNFYFSFIPKNILFNLKKIFNCNKASAQLAKILV